MTKTTNNDPPNNKKNGKLNKSKKNRSNKDKNKPNIVININEKDNVYVNEFNPVAQNNAVSQISYELMNQLIDELIMKVRN